MPIDILSSYFQQPSQLPSELAVLVEQKSREQKILQFALGDLDDKQRFCQHWLILTDGFVFLGRPNGALPEIASDAAHSWQVESYPIEAIEKLELYEGLSSSRLNIIGKDNRLYACVHFTRRQSRAIGNFRFVAEQLLKRTDKAAGEGAGHAIASVGNPAAAYRNAVLEAVEEAKAALSMPKMGVMLRLLSYLTPYKKEMTIGFCLAIALTGLMLIPPILSRILIDDILRPLEKGPNPHAWPMLWAIVAGLALIWSTSEFMSFLRLRIMAITGEKVAMRLRDHLYTHMQKLSLSFFSQRTTGSLITRVSSDTDRLWDFITFGLLDMVVALLQIVGVAIALFFQDWSLALLVLFPIPIMTLMFYYHGKTIQVLYLRIWRKWSAMTGVLSDVIPGMRVVKAFAQEDREVERFQRKNAAVEQEAEILHRHWTRFWPTVVMLMHSCTLIVWIVGAPRVMKYMLSNGSEGMPLGVFIAFTGYMWMFWGPVQHLGMMSRTINRVTTSASRVFEILDTVPVIVNKPGALRIERIEGVVTFENVTFSYDGIRNVLKNISFKVEAGEMIGLVGPSGGGKTTLVNLICRFYDVKDGSVKIDGIDVRDLDVTMLRRQCGVVLQEPYLFHGTIAENIAYGSQNCDIKDIIEAAKAANAHEFICGLPDGYETIVGERGQTLSGGERQRISIARAILHNPRLLILDEATSSVDTETEKRIQEALRRLVSGRTTFAIAHRLSTLSAANRIFVLEEGRLVESGTHRELLAKADGLYAKLYATQMEIQAAIAI